MLFILPLKESSCIAWTRSIKGDDWCSCGIKESQLLLIRSSGSSDCRQWLIGSYCFRCENNDDFA